MFARVFHGKRLSNGPYPGASCSDQRLIGGNSVRFLLPNSRIYSVTKTVADCLKYRGKFDLNLVVRAVQESIQERKRTRQRLVHFARICRVENFPSDVHSSAPKFPLELRTKSIPNSKSPGHPTTSYG